MLVLDAGPGRAIQRRLRQGGDARRTGGGRTGRAGPHPRRCRRHPRPAVEATRRCWRSRSPTTTTPPARGRSRPCRSSPSWCQLGGHCAQEVFAEEPDAAAIARAREACAAYGLNRHAETEMSAASKGRDAGRARWRRCSRSTSARRRNTTSLLKRKEDEAMEKLARPGKVAAVAPVPAEPPQTAVTTPATAPMAPMSAPATGPHGSAGHSQSTSRSSPAASSAPQPSVQPAPAPAVSGPPAMLVERTAFEAFLAEHFGVAGIEHGNPFSMLVAGLDAVQALSGSLGETGPERAMGYVGRLLATAARPQGLAARLRGGHDLRRPPRGNPGRRGRDRGKRPPRRLRPSRTAGRGALGTDHHLHRRGDARARLPPDRPHPPHGPPSSHSPPPGVPGRIAYACSR